MQHEPDQELRPASGGGFLDGLVGDLRQQLADLVRTEIRMARNEMTRNAMDMGKDAGMLGAGGALMYAGLLVLLASVTSLLTKLLPRWLAAFVVGAATIATGALLANEGRKKLAQAEVMPEQTIDTVKQSTSRMVDELTSG